MLKKAGNKQIIFSPHCFHLGFFIPAFDFVFISVRICRSQWGYIILRVLVQMAPQTAAEAVICQHSQLVNPPARQGVSVVCITCLITVANIVSNASQIILYTNNCIMPYSLLILTAMWSIFFIIPLICETLIEMFSVLVIFGIFSM